MVLVHTSGGYCFQYQTFLPLSHSCTVLFDLITSFYLILSPNSNLLLQSNGFTTGNCSFRFRRANTVVSEQCWDFSRNKPSERKNCSACWSSSQQPPRSSKMLQTSHTPVCINERKYLFQKNWKNKNKPTNMVLV